MVESGGLLGSGGAAAGNKTLKKQMQQGENPSSLTAAPLCRDDQGSGKIDWMETGVRLSLHTNSDMCTCTA